MKTNQLLVVEKVLFVFCFALSHLPPSIYQMSEAMTLKKRLQIWFSVFLSFKYRITKCKGDSEESVLERISQLFLRFTGRPQFFRRENSLGAAENAGCPVAHAESKQGTPEGGHMELWLQIFRDGGHILARRWRGLERQRAVQRVFSFSKPKKLQQRVAANGASYLEMCAAQSSQKRHVEKICRNLVCLSWLVSEAAWMAVLLTSSQASVWMLQRVPVCSFFFADTFVVNCSACRRAAGRIKRWRGIGELFPFM